MRNGMHGTLVLGAALMMVLAGCSGGGEDGKQGRSAGAAKDAARVDITPANGTKGARPDKAITLRPVNGTMQNVTVTSKGAPVQGSLNAQRTQWTPRWPLSTSTAYEVVATAQDSDGETVTSRSAFTTLKPKKTFAATAVAPFDRETVGVGMPVILTFDRPVYNKEAVERALEVRSSTPAEGAWRWIDRQQVVYRTKKYWEPRTEVSVIAHMKGVRAAKGVYGTRDMKLRFKVGNEQVSVAGSKSKKMTVKKNGKTVRKIPISMGNASKRAYTTTNGIHLTMERAYHVVMDSATVGIPKGHPDYYKLDVYWTVRISNSGEFTHSAPWSVGSQGSTNVSHGCVNMSPKNATWFYKFSKRGDIYKITGTDRELEWNNGWGFWQMSWNKWRKGSALQ